MEIKINDTVVNVPSDLSQITVGQFIQYWNQYGRDIDKRIKDVLEAKYEDEVEQSMDLIAIEYDEAIAWYSFFTGYDFSVIKGLQADELLKVYRAIKSALIDSEKETYKLNQDIEWNNDTWSIRDWKITPGAFTFNELLTSKEATRQIHQLGKSKWEALPYLCAIFFRKKGEPFDEKFLDEGSERLKLMQQLPMSYALQVAFFLSVSVTIAQEVLVSSKVGEVESPALPSTSTVGAG